MKNLFKFFILAVLICFPIYGAFAGDVPEAILTDDDAQLYFGEIISWEKETCYIKINPLQQIKGDLSINSEITYSQLPSHLLDMPFKLNQTYLIAYIDENNLYFLETSSMDTQTLQIKDSKATDDDMLYRMQQYLNEGKYEEAEKARVNSISASSNKPSSLPDIEIPNKPNRMLYYLFAFILVLFAIRFITKQKR